MSTRGNDYIHQDDPPGADNEGDHHTRSCGPPYNVNAAHIRTITSNVVVISDRDPRFTAEVWRETWARLGTNLKMTTAHRPQADGQSKRANRQVVEYLRHRQCGRFRLGRRSQCGHLRSFQDERSGTCVTLLGNASATGSCSSCDHVYDAH
jgi:hypothetical protein